MINTINPLYLGSSGGGLVPTIRAYAPVGSSVSCDGQTKVVGADGFVDFVVSAEPRNILPDGVQGLESIESTGTQWIDLNMSARAMDFGWYVDAEFTQPKNSTAKCLVGLRQATDIQKQLMWWNGDTYSYGDASVMDWRSWAQSKTTGSLPIGVTSNGVRFQTSYIYVSDGVMELTKADGTALTNANGCNKTNVIDKWYLFGRYSNDTGLYLVEAKLYQAIAYHKTIAERNLIPCIYNNSVGMWDVVSNSFFGNQGTGAFIAGEPKEWLDFPTYTVTVNGASQIVKVDKVGLFPVSFN